MFTFLFPRQPRPGDCDRDRGVSEIIGAILIFGLLLLLLVVVQATAVPTWNQQEEFEHSQRVQTDLQTLDADADAVATDGTARTAVVETGVRYPSRPFLINPPPASGSIQVTATGTVDVENAEVVGVDNYWGPTESFDAHALTYEANYREYRNGPTARYENGLLYNEFDSGATLLLGGHRPVDGRTIDLRMIDGDLSRSADASLSLDLRPTSAPARTVNVQSRDGSPVVIRLPTTLDEPTLREEVFDGQIDPAGAPDEPQKYVQSVTVSGGVATITLEGGGSDPIEYRFRMSEVGFGATTPEEPAYITAVGDTGPTVVNGSSVDLTAEVRDKYNNPVSGVSVTFTTTGSGSLSDTTVRTGPDGRATASYQTPPNPSTSQVKATIAGPSAPANTEQWTITGDPNAGAGTGAGGPGGSGPEDAVSSVNPGANPVLPYIEGVDIGGGSADLCFTSDPGTTAWTFSEMRVSLYFSSGGAPTAVDVNDRAVPTPTPTTTLTIGGSYENTASTVGTLNPGQRMRVEHDFNAGISGSGNQFFVLSVRFDNGADIRTLSYIISVTDSGSCP
jgi:hypothetical protein